MFGKMCDIMVLSDQIRYMYNIKIVSETVLGKPLTAIAEAAFDLIITMAQVKLVT